MEDGPRRGRCAADGRNHAEADKRFAVWEERSRTFVTKDYLAAALARERKHTDAQFARVWGEEGLMGVRAEIKELGDRVTALHEKMFGTAARSVRILTGLGVLILMALQIYTVFFRG